MKLLGQLPNTLTLINLFSGTLAIIAMARGQVSTALILMGVCLLADILDGLIARKLGVAGELGIQLDSLADVVSFGALPAMMLFYIGDRYGNLNLQMVAIIASVSAASAGLRLARFNIDTRARQYFWGLATPSGAIMIASWLWAHDRGLDYGFGVGDMPYLLPAIALFITIAYHLPVRLPGLKSPRHAMIMAGILFAGVIIGFFLIGPVSITAGILLYVVMGIINLAAKWY